ncbi:MAG: TIGR02186 family protein [Proteobacteria bacterium]|nr:TIGR02186 family protein [Pseudomonadota bacterium]
MKRILLFLLGLAFLANAAGIQAADVDFTVGQSTVDMDLFYNGASIPVTGAVPEGALVVVRFIGKIGEVSMKQKGKAMGLLWMNMNTLHFSHMPAICLVEASAPLAGTGQVGEKLGLAGVTDSIVIEPASADRQMLLPEILKLKKSEGLYREDGGAVKLESAKDGRQAFSASVRLPSRLTPGEYSIEVFAVKDGEIVGQSVKPIAARLVGVPAFIANLAFNHGLWYGILASLISMLAGLAVGLIFGSKGAH